MAEDLAGRWIGRYDYAGARPVPFEARMSQDGAALEAATVEPNTFAPGLGPELAGWLRGTVADGEVRLTKTYAFDQGRDPEYRGRVDAAGTRIVGRWRFPGLAGASGGFAMSRAPDVVARAGRRAKADADA